MDRLSRKFGIFSCFFNENSACQHSHAENSFGVIYPNFFFGMSSFRKKSSDRLPRTNFRDVTKIDTWWSAHSEKSFVKGPLCRKSFRNDCIRRKNALNDPFSEAFFRDEALYHESFGHPEAFFGINTSETPIFYSGILGITSPYTFWVSYTYKVFAHVEHWGSLLCWKHFF